MSIAIVLSLSTTVLAQSERYVQVGTDSDGDAYLLDTKNMGKADPPFGQVIKLYQTKNDLMLEHLLNAGCGDERLWIAGMRVYGRNGVKLSEKKSGQEIPARGDSPGATAMKYYCHSIGARGW
ncbi:hypothetical protein [Richelia sinica]|uniref:hypothetical protein n=1 Tax=Richelia sinica TaxID=1357545 RepID=UPI0016849C32|nr:hypothetical protein [Richelia sinica]MBD2667377.1 hypothetical protein [Richelia sinica FACHB-800]